MFTYCVHSQLKPALIREEWAQHPMSRGLFKIVASCTAAGTQGYSETPLLLAGYPFDTALELLNGANPAMVSPAPTFPFPVCHHPA